MTRIQTCCVATCEARHGPPRSVCASVHKRRTIRETPELESSMPLLGRTGIPEATVARLPIYLRVLTGLADAGVGTVSSDGLAAAAGVGSAKLRTDLSHLRSYGTRGVGYDVEYLVYQISRALGLTQSYRVAIIGVGNLGHALANYAGFATRGFEVAALVDAASRLVGQRVVGMEIRHLDELEQ